MAINCICYPLKYLSVSTFKDTLFGEFLLPHSYSLRNFPQRAVKAHSLCEILRSLICNVHILNFKIVGNLMAHN